MKFSLFFLFAIFAFVNAHTGYSYENGAADRWGELDESFKLCSDGRRQSPINLNVCAAKIKYNSCLAPSMRPGLRVPMKFEPSTNNFHLDCKKDSKCGTLRVAGKKFNLIQLHMHAKSEHTLNGESYPLEMHFVHQAKDKKLAVFGVFFKEGAHNPQLQRILDASKHNNKVIVNLAKLSGAHRVQKTCTYDGSLTTPPCSEDVSWVVSTRIMQASESQIKQYRAIVGNKENNRPIQKLNARKVVCYARKHY